MSDNQEMNEQVQPEESAMIPKEQLEHVLNDMHKYKRLVQQEQEQRQAVENKLKELETQAQVEQGNYKQLYETVLTDLEKEREKNQRTISSIVEDKKLSAVREFARKKNIREEALEDLDMIDLGPVVVETTDTGRYNVIGADQFVDALQKAKPHWFLDSKPPQLNNAVGTFSGEDRMYTPKEVAELQRENPALYKDIMNNKRHLIKRR